MNPLLPKHALTLLGPDRAGDWGGVPWDRAEAVGPGMYLPPSQQPMRNLLALFAQDKVVIVTANVDDDCDGPGGSVDIDPCYEPDTSLRWPDGRSIDSRTFRGMVMHAVIEKRGGGLGDFGISCFEGILHCVQYYDLGPTKKTQEGSEKTLRDFGVIDPGQSSRHAATVGNDVQDFCSLIFCGSAPKDRHGRPYAVPQDETITRTLALWKRFTGRVENAPAAASGAAPCAATRGTAAGSVGVAVPLALALATLLLPVADAPLPDLHPNAVREWMEIFFWLIGGMIGIVTLWKMLKGEKPLQFRQPLEVKFHEVVATKEEVAKIELDLRNQMKELRIYVHEAIHEISNSVNSLKLTQTNQTEEMRDLFNDLDTRNEVRVEKVHNRINEVIDRMPEKIIGLLRNTGALKL